jgi:hypothetical protein
MIKFKNLKKKICHFGGCFKGLFPQAYHTNAHSAMNEHPELQGPEKTPAR